MRKAIAASILSILSMAGAFAVPAAVAQDAPIFTPHFPAEEFVARRHRLAEGIGPGSLAVVQGAPSPAGYVPFRQSNSFYYLTGVETPHAYLRIEGGSGRSTLYLPHRDPRREASEGKVLTAEDADRLRELTGVDAVHGVEALSDHLARYAWGPEGPTLYVPHAPAEMTAMSRDLATRAVADAAADPWDGRPSREGHFINLVEERFPRIEIRDLSPILDRMRLIKSERELALIRRASELSELALLETMRSVGPGTMEYEIDALARFVFLRHGARGLAYYSLVGAGPNAWYPHYHRGGRRMQEGDFLLVDAGPDYGYYSADVTRMMPVSGTFNDWQHELYGFYLDCYLAILDNIRPGEVADIMRDAAAGMEQALERREFSKPEYERAARAFVDRYVSSARYGARSLGHWVGMAVHDVGAHDGTLRPGMVFTIEPQFRVPEERVYIRLEDMIVITEEGAEVLSRELPLEIDAIEAMMAEEGLLQRYPRMLEPLELDAEGR